MPLRYDINSPVLTAAEIFLGSQEAAAELGGSLEASMQHSGLTPAQVIDGEGFVPLHKVVSFLNHAAQELDCDYFGLLVAKHQPPARFAMIGQLVRFSRDLGHAIDDGIRFSILNSQYSRWVIERDQHAMSLIREVRVQLDAPIIQMQTLALAVTYKAMNGICQRRINLNQVTFSHAQPPSHEKIKAFFGVQVFYDQPQTALVFPNAELESPIPSADPQVHKLLLRHFEDLSGEEGANLNLIERVRRELRQTVGSRRCTLELIAQSWGVHPRGLQRRLREHGTGFRELLQDVRQELAESYLTNSDIAVLELADLLGYRNASAFSRAFKVQTGSSPEHWRESRQIESES